MDHYIEIQDWPIPRTELRSEKDNIAIIHEPGFDSNLPEVIERPPTPQPPEVRGAPDGLGLPEPLGREFPEAVEGSEGSRANRRICGIRLWLLIILIIALVLAVTGGVVGAILGIRASKSPLTASHGAAQTTAGSPISTSAAELIATSTISTLALTPSPSSTLLTSTSSPSSNPQSSLSGREKFKFSSIAASHSEGTSQTQVFYMQSGNIHGSIEINDSWKHLGELHPSISPKPSSPITTTSWVDSKINDGAADIRIYYFNTENRIIEFGGRCSGDPAEENPCTWFDCTVIGSSDVANDSSISVIRSGNSTQVAGFQVRVYYENEEGGIGISVYSDSRWGTSTTPITIMPGTSIGATSEVYNDQFAGRIWYTGPDKGMYRRTFVDSNWHSSPMGGERPDQNLNGTTIDPYATFGAANTFTAHGDANFDTWTGMIADDRRVILNGSPQSGDIGDDAGGALAILAWVDERNISVARYYYNVDGSIHEMQWSNDAWSKGTVFPS